MTGYCWLKRTDGLRIPHPKMIIGPKFCANMASNPHTPTPKEACSVTATQVRGFMPCVEITLESSDRVARLRAATSRPSIAFKKALRAFPLPPPF